MKPFMLNLKVKNLKFLAIHNFNYAATSEANNIIQCDFDLDYFTDEQVLAIVDLLDLFIIYIFINCKTCALDALRDIRNILDKVFVNNLLLVNRFFKKEIGTLDILPDDVLFTIRKNVYANL
jgi:hypothetical protein